MKIISETFNLSYERLNLSAVAPLQELFQSVLGSNLILQYRNGNDALGLQTGNSSFAVGPQSLSFTHNVNTRLTESKEAAFDFPSFCKRVTYCFEKQLKIKLFFGGMVLSVYVGERNDARISKMISVKQNQGFQVFSISAMVNNSNGESRSVEIHNGLRVSTDVLISSPIKKPSFFKIDSDDVLSNVEFNNKMAFLSIPGFYSTFEGISKLVDLTYSSYESTINIFLNGGGISNEF